MNYQQSIFPADNKPVYEKSIERLQFAAEVARHRGQEKLHVCFSGGKDSVVLAHLCKVAGIPYQLHYNITGVDPPEVYHFIKNRGDVIMHSYKKSMWRLIVEKKLPPTRLIRYCCAELKEHGGEEELCVTGVRWAESTKRKGRRPYETIGDTKAEKILFNDNDEGRMGFENCLKKHKLVTNPIIDWTDADIWDYIRHEKIPYCSLYDEGFKRIGCIGCPMASAKQKETEFSRWPGFKGYYLSAFERMLKVNTEVSYTWKTGQEVFDWWLYGNKGVDIIDGQISFIEETEC